MLDYIQLRSLATSIENNFVFDGRVYDMRNSNPLDLIQNRADVNCAARAFVLAVAMEQLFGDEHMVQFAYHEDHKKPEADGKLAQFAGENSKPRMFIAHARVEIGDGETEPHAIDPEYASGFRKQTIHVKPPPHYEYYPFPGPRFNDPVGGLKDYCSGHTSMTEFDLRDIDTAHEILMSRDFSQNIAQVSV